MTLNDVIRLDSTHSTKTKVIAFICNTANTCSIQFNTMWSLETTPNFPELYVSFAQKIGSGHFFKQLLKCEDYSAFLCFKTSYICSTLHWIHFYHQESSLFLFVLPLIMNSVTIRMGSIVTTAWRRTSRSCCSCFIRLASCRKASGSIVPSFRVLTATFWVFL